MKLSIFTAAFGRWATCLAVVSALAACGGGGDGGDPVVATTSGSVVGNAGAASNSYLGIPYAAPPVGPLRWAAPAAPTAWNDIRQARSVGSHCAQPATGFGAVSTSEDCLYLNVYTPKTPGPHPVMVWIHGGAFYLGLGSAYNPQRLVDQGMVVVTLNYRLGALGFMSHSALSTEQGGKSGNYGLMDQQAALRWVQSNIANFGGSKDNVTIFGESAGGFSVHSHLASAGSTGLFHKAIIMSGAYALDGQDTLTAAEAKGVTVAATASGGSTCTTLACLRALPVSALLGAQSVAWPSGPIPSVDGTVLATSVKASLTAGTYNKVPVIQGTTQDEWRLFVALDEVTPTSVATPYKGAALNSGNYAAAIAGTFPFLALNPSTIPGLIAHPTLSPYRTSAYSNSPSLALAALGTDLLFSCNARVSSKLQKANNAVYAYEFADRTAPPVSFAPATISFPRGAEHTSELAYLFDLSGKTLTAPQAAVATTMVGYWTRFARTGNPNTTTAPTAWPAFGANDSVLTFNDVGTTLASDAAFAAAHNCAAWTPSVSEAATTATGSVVGTGSTTMRSFRGIPYAAAPVGALRWAPPAAPAAWTTPRAATAFGNHCPQSASLGSGSTTEDCLYLNVFTPTTTGPHPVVVWFHGGAFVGGTAATYVPTALVGQDTVVVTVNYRIGALGFLAHPALSAEGGGSSSNYGLMDQQQALRWVRDNVANFGGNASNVTIMGESAGGFSVMSHLASSTSVTPAPSMPSTGLFHKAIVQSGAYSTGQLPLATAYTAWQAVPTAGSCSTTGTDAGTAACLRSMSVSAVLTAQATAFPSGPQPINDGRVLTGSVLPIIAAGTHNRVPVLQGTTRDEWRYFAASSELSSGVALNSTTYPLAVTGLFGAPTANALLPLYPVANYANAAEAYGALGTDAIFACNGRNSSLELSQHASVYTYEFRDRTAPPPLPTTGVGGPLSFSQGAAHASELTYLFSMSTRGALNTEQQVLSATMTRYWARFARAGNPNGGTDATWAPFTSTSPLYQGLDVASASGVAVLPATTFSANPANLPGSHFCTTYTATP